MTTVPVSTLDDFIPRARDALAASLVGIPFSWGGYSVLGADCFGIVRLFYSRLGMELPCPSYDCEPPSGREWFLDIAGRYGWKRVDAPEWGDVALFKINGNYNHIGVYLSPRGLLHSTKKTGSVIQRPPKTAAPLYFRYEGERL